MIDAVLVITKQLQKLRSDGSVLANVKYLFSNSNV